MKYKNKKMLSNIQRMKHLKKSMKKMQEISDRNSKDPGSGLNTRLQKSGMGEISNSHAKRIGNILNNNASEKAIEVINKITDPDKSKKKKKKQEIVQEETVGFNEHDGELKVTYNNKNMSFSEFLKNSRIDFGIGSILKALMAKKKKDNFNGKLKDYIIKNYSGKDFALDVVYRGTKVNFKKD